MEKSHATGNEKNHSSYFISVNYKLQPTSQKPAWPKMAPDRRTRMWLWNESECERDNWRWARPLVGPGSSSGCDWSRAMARFAVKAVGSVLEKRLFPAQCFFLFIIFSRGRSDTRPLWCGVTKSKSMRITRVIVMLSSQHNKRLNNSKQDIQQITIWW